MLMVWLPEADSLTHKIILTEDLFLRAHLFGTFITVCMLELQDRLKMLFRI